MRRNLKIWTFCILQNIQKIIFWALRNLQKARNICWWYGTRKHYVLRNDQTCAFYALQNTEQVLVFVRYGNHRKRALCVLLNTQKAFLLFVTKAEACKLCVSRNAEKVWFFVRYGTHNKRAFCELRNTQGLWSLRVTERTDCAHCMFVACEKRKGSVFLACSGTHKNVVFVRYETPSTRESCVLFLGFCNCVALQIVNKQWIS